MFFWRKQVLVCHYTFVWLVAMMRWPVIQPVYKTLSTIPSLNNRVVFVPRPLQIQIPSERRDQKQINCHRFCENPFLKTDYLFTQKMNRLGWNLIKRNVLILCEQPTFQQPTWWHFKIQQHDFMLELHISTINDQWQSFFWTSIIFKPAWFLI